MAMENDRLIVALCMVLLLLIESPSPQSPLG